MSSGRSLPQINLCFQGGIQGDSHSGAQRNINSELRVGSSFRVIPEQYFLGVENVTEFLENNLAYYEIPTQLACAYLKVHLMGRALDWNRSELETLFYASYQNQNQRTSDFVYELLKIHKNLKLEMAAEKLLDSIISRLEPQLLDYVEVHTRRLRLVFYT
ncbi:uncharacterized protein TNCV_636261 [Trichonephila clavipes]|nr:uncharacterized protein TNCV_636261 [Trichonephila clavipes]